MALIKKQLTKDYSNCKKLDEFGEFQRDIFTQKVKEEK